MHGPVHVVVCMNNVHVCAHVMTVYLIAVETKMHLEMLHMEKHGPCKHGPSRDAQEKWENFALSVGLSVDTWKLLSCE